MDTDARAPEPRWPGQYAAGSGPANGSDPARSDAARASSPTALRIVLGAHLRRLREVAGVSRVDAGYAIRGSHAKISRLESGRVASKRRDLVDLLTLYGVRSAEQQQRWLEMAEQANSPGWWHSYGDVMPGWFETYLRLEQAATVIRTYEVQFVPGLLQTEDYARAAITQGRTDPEEIERGVQLRMQRKPVLISSDAPTFWAVIDEGALRRRYGTPEVHQAQIKHLIELADLPTVTVQILPFERGGHARVAGAFSVLRFAEPELPDVVYLEQLTSSVYLDKRAEVEAYTRAMDEISAHAATPDESVEIMRSMLREV